MELVSERSRHEAGGKGAKEGKRSESSGDDENLPEQENIVAQVKINSHQLNFHEIF